MSMFTVSKGTGATEVHWIVSCFNNPNFCHATVMIKEHLHTVLKEKYNFVRYPVPFERAQTRRKRGEQSCPHIFVTYDPDVLSAYRSWLQIGRTSKE